MGDVKDVLLLDVTPLSLGIETLGGVFTKIIEKNTTIPVKKSQVFSTAQDNQPAVSISVLQGERARAADNHKLGEFTLEGIPSAPRGIPQIEVTFDIDANGIVHVGAKDLGTGKENVVTITGSSNLSKDDIDKMKKDAESHEEDDKKFTELVEVRNQADQLLMMTETTIKENEDKLQGTEKEDMEKAAEALKEVKDTDNLEDIRAKIDELSKASQGFATRLYQDAQQANAAQGDAQGGEDKQDDEVQDAVVVED